MRHAYEPFVIRKMAAGRMFFVNAKMPFEYFLDCFQVEQPFFLISHLADGRIAVTPNANVIPQNMLQAGRGPWNLLPTDFEYVTMRGTYPVIVTAHPVPKVNEWLSTFERLVIGFAKQPLEEFVSTSFEVVPLGLERRESAQPRETIRETMREAMHESLHA